MRQVVLAIPALALGGCAALQDAFGPVGGAAAEAPVSETVVILQPAAPPPPPGAVTAEAFDTTTEEDRAEALAAPEPAAERTLGTTVATLGAPSDPGIWLKTPLVDAVTEGRVDYEGRSVNLELRPSGGEAGSGSQLSLPAMRLLEAPLAGVLELTVFAG